MSRRYANAGLIVLALVFAAVALAVLARGTLLEALIERALAARGVAVSGVSVVEVGFYRAVVDDLHLGEEDEIVIGSLVARYAPSTLIRGRIESLAVRSSTVRLDATGRGPLLGTLQPVLEGEGGPPPVPPVGAITISAARVEAATPLGAVRAGLTGKITPRASGELVAEIDYEAEGAPGAFSGTLSLRRAATGELSGTARIGDGSIALAGTELAALGGEIAFASVAGGSPEIDAELSSARVAAPGEVGGELSLQLDVGPEAAQVEGDFRSAAGEWSVRGRARVEDYLASGRAHLELHSRVGAGAAVVGLLGFPPPESGTASMMLRADAVIGSLLAGGAAWPVARARLETIGAGGELSLQIRDVAYPERLDALNARLELDARLEDGVLEVDLARDADLHTGGVSEQWLRTLGAPAFAARALRDGAEVSLRANEAGAPTLTLNLSGGAPSFDLRGTASMTTPEKAQAGITARARGTLSDGARVADLAVDRLRLTAAGLVLPGARLSTLIVEGRLAGEPRRLEGELDVIAALRDVEAESLSAHRLETSLPAAVRLQPGDVELETRGGGRVRATSLRGPGGARIEALGGAIESARVQARLEQDGEARVIHRVSLGVDPFTLTIPRPGEDALVAEAAAGEVVLEGRLTRGVPYRPSVRFAEARVSLPGHGVAAERLEGFVDSAGGERPLAELRDGTLRSTAPSPRFAPLRLQGTVRRDGETLAFDATAHAAKDVAVLDLRARHAPASRSGEAVVSLGPLRFASDGLQPQSLSPGLARLRAASGVIEGRSELTWKENAREGRATLRIDDLSFEVDEIDVRGLALDLTLDTLFPPSSPPEQRLAVRRIDAAVPAENVDVRFRIEGGERPRLAIASARAAVSGGWLALGDTVFDPAEERQELTIEVEELDLAEALSIVDVKGLSGTGRLSGAIPIRVGGGALAVEGGRLAATGPGILRFESEQASRVLSAGGESVDLLLRALEDFHYEDLTIGLEKPEGADATVALSILGANPDVLDGYPFRLNVNVEGRTGKVLAAIAEIYGLSNRLLRRAWMFAR